MGDCPLLGWLNLLAVLLTAGVVAWYTVETARLRREAERQTELQNRPFMSLVLDGLRFHLINVGKGVATSIVIADVPLTGNSRYRLHAEPITHVAPGQIGRLRWTVFQAAPGGDFRPMWGGESFADERLAEHGAQLRVTYQGLVGERPYETVLSIRERTEEFPQPRITII